MTLSDLKNHLRSLRGVQHKLDIQHASGALAPANAIRNGDDCAAIPDGEGHLLFAIEGLIDEFVQAEPWFAGYCAVMVNASDIYSMGGRPIALVDAIWSQNDDHAKPIWQGMREAAEKYAIPIVGGHTNTRSPSDHLAAAILGRAGKKLLTSFDAKSGDTLVAAIDLRGEWYGPYPYWNCSTTAPGERLRADLEILPAIAETGLCAAAKDVSMGGLIGTATMLAECSNVGMEINVDLVPRPANITLEKWLSSFPSYGFVLSVSPPHANEVIARFAAREIAAAPIGQINDSKIITLTNSQGHHATFWDLNANAFIGYGGSR